MIAVRPATEVDISAYFKGNQPEGMRNARLLAYVAVKRGEVLGVGGIIYMPNGDVMAFFDLNDEGRKHAVTVHRAALRVLSTWQLRGHKSLLIRLDRSIPRAEAWARRLGFAPLHDQEGVWAWRG